MSRISRTLFPIALLAALVLAGGCGQKTSDRSLAFVDADEGSQLIAGQKRLMGLAGRTSGAWVDPRSEEEFRAERIPGAIHLPVERARRDHHVLDEYNVVVVYGEDYNSSRANALSKLLMDLGHRDVRTLRGGFRAWKRAGHPVESD